MVLPQGGRQFQFGKCGDTDFNLDAYSAEILARLEKLKVLDTAPRPDQIVNRITMAGHSGAGATLGRMAKESVRRDKEARATRLGKLALMRLDNDLEALKSFQSDAQKREYLRTAQRLRGYYSAGKHGGTYISKAPVTMSPRARNVKTDKGGSEHDSPTFDRHPRH